VAAVVLTSGRRCSRSRVENGDGVATMAFPAAYSPLLRSGSFLRCERPSLLPTSGGVPGGVGAPVLARLPAPPLPGTSRWRRARFFPRSGASGAVVEEETPRGGGWLGVRATPAWPLLKRSRGQLEEEKPPLPSAVRRAGQVALEADAWGRLGCSVEGQMGL
jgi:hypothetical protein